MDHDVVMGRLESGCIWVPAGPDMLPGGSSPRVHEHHLEHMLDDELEYLPGASEKLMETVVKVAAPLMHILCPPYCIQRRQSCPGCHAAGLHPRMYAV
jgi:hypothetical protein